MNINERNENKSLLNYMYSVNYTIKLALLISESEGFSNVRKF